MISKNCADGEKRNSKNKVMRCLLASLVAKHYSRKTQLRSESKGLFYSIARGFVHLIPRGGWEAARLPWEKDVGEIPQGCKPEEARHFPHRKASSSQPPRTLHKATNPVYLENKSTTIPPYN